MSAKDNFAQAMKELLNGGEGENSTPASEEKKAAPSTFSSFSQPESRPPRAPAPEKKEEKPAPSLFGGGAPAYKPEEKAEEVKPAEVVEVAEAVEVVEEPAKPMFSEPAAVPAPAPVAEPAPVAAPQAAVVTSPEKEVSHDPGAFSDDLTVIGRGTTIIGDISTAGGLRVGGSIKGNLKVTSTMELNGKVIGDVEAEDAVITASVIKGNVTVKNVINMDRGTTIIGDVSAKSVQINGKIKGNLTVEERGHFESNAILVGNLVSGTVIIDEGAMLKGDIAITSAQTEDVTVDEPDFDIDIDF